MPFSVVRNDLTRMSVDAIVNTANPEPIFMSGTDSAIYTTAGAEQMLAARKRIGHIEPGEAGVTPAFQLRAKIVIHTVGPVWRLGKYGEEDILRRCYENSLKTAAEYGCTSIAFPLISTGVYGFPKKRAMEIAVDAIHTFLMKSDMDVYLVLFDRDSYEVGGSLFPEIDAYIDEHYAAKREREEYSRGWSKNEEDDFEKTLRFPESRFHEPEIPLTRSRADFRIGSSAPYEQAQRHETITLEEFIKDVEKPFPEPLLDLIVERNLTNAEVYKRANITRQVFSKILCNKDYTPKKETVLSLAIALELNQDQTKDLLSRAGYALSPSSKTDLIVRYFIEQRKFNIMTINVALFDYGQPLLNS